MSSDNNFASNQYLESEPLCSVVCPDPDREVAVEPPRRLDATAGNPGRASDAGISARRMLVRGTEPLPRNAGPQLVPKSILGLDERVRILDTKAPPWRMICSLRIRGSAQFIGTGWFAGPRTVITAGHCVFDPQMGGWAKEIAVIPARDSEYEPFGELRSRRFATTNRWRERQDPDFDYAVIHLGPEADDITAETGWFSTVALNDSALASQRINVAGYPGDKGSGALQGGEQWFHAKQVVHTTPRRIFYDVDTMGGQSGAPAWLDTDEGPMVVGIHAYGSGGASHLGIQANSAPRITEAVLGLLRSWIGEG